MIYYYYYTTNFLHYIHREGDVLTCLVDELNVADKRLLLSIPGSTGRGSYATNNLQQQLHEDYQYFEQLNKEEWIAATVEKVTSYGLFVRPAGHDVKG
jgi:hypothetical protein